MTKPKVLVTGASGLIGGLVLRELADRYEFSGLSRHAVAGIPYTQAPITDLVAVRRAVAGMDMVLHLAGETKNDDDWDDHFNVTAGGTINVLRAAADAGVRRVVVMSTGSTMCGWEWDDSLPYGRLAAGERDLPAWDLLDYRTPPRPDSPYGAAKLFGEAAARWFSDRTPMSVLVIRLGAVLAENRPTLIRHFPGFLAQEDAVQMIDRCLSAPDSVKYGIFDAISENSTRWRDTTPAKEVLGWEPTGSSDRFDPSELSR
ncbi:MAG: NAD(P)-dependent oxidoreductase [Chloroflexota bacterium]